MADARCPTESYDVVDLVAMPADDLPRPNLITWIADVERSRHPPQGAGRADAGAGGRLVLDSGAGLWHETGGCGHLTLHR